MISNEISEFYSFWSQAESREVLYWSIRTLGPIFLKQNNKKWTFQKVYMNLEKKIIEIGQKFLKIYPKYESGGKTRFFSTWWQHWAKHL